MAAVTPLMHVPLGQIADIKFVKGPTAIKSEEGLLVSYVFVDFSGRDVGATWTKPSQGGLPKIPEGYRLQWSGEYDISSRPGEVEDCHPAHAPHHLCPHLFQYRSTAKTLFVLLACPFPSWGPSGFSTF